VNQDLWQELLRETHRPVHGGVDISFWRMPGALGEVAVLADRAFSLAAAGSSPLWEHS